jgi:hypothetical protein
MNHWQQYQRLYIGAVIFVGVNAAAFVVVFGSLSAAELDALTRRQIIVGLIKCVAIASLNLQTYLQSSKPVPITT